MGNIGTCLNNSVTMILKNNKGQYMNELSKYEFWCVCVPGGGGGGWS